MDDSREERLLREKSFHNETFSTDTRKAAKKYYKSASRSKEYYHERILDQVSGKKVLEYGCGPGSAAFDLARNGAVVSAIDISDVAIRQTSEKATREGLKIEVMVMDAENLSFGADSFDLICGSGILHHLDLDRSYKELQRVLRPRGRAVFFEPMGHNPIINLYRNLTPSMRTEDEHPLLVQDIILAEQFFKKVSAKHFNLLAIAGSFIPFLAGPLNKVDEVLFKIMPFLKKHSWIVILEFSSPR